jgi:glycosyltransferase involved in cell wall biosynthesis
MIKHFLNKKKINVITNGIEDEAYADVEKEASDKIKKQVTAYGRYLIQIGRIYRIKNYETMIRALALLPKDVNYVIAGPVQDNDEYLGKLKSLIKELGLEKRVYFIGVVKGVDKYYLIKKAQMMVHMALWESYCNVVHEGLSQGKVCIVADNTALPLLIKNDVNGYCVETTDHEELAKKINYVLENKQTKKIIEMEKRNQEIGLLNSWEQVSQKLQAWNLHLMNGYDK